MGCLVALYFVAFLHERFTILVGWCKHGFPLASVSIHKDPHVLLAVSCLLRRDKAKYLNSNKMAGEMCLPWRKRPWNYLNLSLGGSFCTQNLENMTLLSMWMDNEPHVWIFTLMKIHKIFRNWKFSEALQFALKSITVFAPRKGCGFWGFQRTFARVYSEQLLCDNNAIDTRTHSHAASLKTRQHELGKQTPLQLPPTPLVDAFCIPRVKHVSRLSTWRLHYSFITFWVPSQGVSMKFPLAEPLARRSTRLSCF